MKRVVGKGIHIVFSLLMVLILIATFILDKNVDSVFPNTVIYANGVYYLLAGLIIWGIFFIHRSIHGQGDISDREFKILCISLPLIIWGGWQIPVGRWIYWFTNAGDFGSIMYAAIGFNNGESFADWTYFLQSPNNANLAIVLSWIYSFTKDWRLILILGASLTNVSAVFVALSVKNFTNNKFAGICSLIAAELLMAMTWRAFLVYTDNYGMIFVALIVWVYTLDISDKFKLPIITVLTACGTFIKATIFILFIAILLHKIFVSPDISKNSRCLIRNTITYILLVLAVFGTLIFSQTALRSYHGLDLTGEYPKSWQYMFMVGQNSDVYGVTNSEDSAIRSAVIDEAIQNGEDNEHVKDKLLGMAVNRIKSRGICGNIKFYINKLNVAYNDGYFHNVQASEETPISNELEENLIYNLLSKNGKYYQLSAAILQIAWNAVLLLLIFSIVGMKKTRSIDILKF